MRAGIVLVRDGRVALIRRAVATQPEPYYLFPGGGVEAGESLEDAAVREAREELGLVVRVGRLVAWRPTLEREQRYFLATAIAGTFGTGNGEEMARMPGHPRGSYTAVWMPLTELPLHDVRPRSLAAALCQGSLPPDGSVLTLLD